MEYEKVIITIVEAQEAVIGEMAVSQANTVTGLNIGTDKKVTVSGDAGQVVNDLVDSYRQLFGNIAVEVCKEAAHKAQPGVSDELFPESLRT